MTRLTAIFVALVALVPASGCYAPERMTAADGSTPSETQTASDDACTGDCEVCASYCATMIVCASDPPTVQDCAFDCINALASSTDDCSDARRDAMECVGSLTCEEFSSDDACADAYGSFATACEGEYDEAPTQAPQMIAG